jgi:hypothetical protein
MSNEKAECGTDLNPTANVDLRYAHEFPNGNVVLVDTDGIIYFFNGSQVIRPTSHRNLGGTSDISAPGGIGILSGSGVKYYATPNFLIAHDSSNGKLVVVTREGKVIKEDSGVTGVNTSCETVTKGTTTYKLNTDGTSSTTTIPTSIPTTTSVSGKYLVRDGDEVYLSDSKCSATGVLVDTIDSTTTTIHEAQMVKVIDSNNNPHFFIAMRTSEDSNKKVRYYRVSGNTATELATITLHTANKYHYALDGRGRLYAITAANTVSVRNTDGTSAGTASVSSVTFAGLLGLADRALAREGSNVHEITTTGSTANAANKGSFLHESVEKCTSGDTRAIDGAGTNFIRCAHSSGLYSLTYDSGNGLYSKASHTVSISSSNDVKFATGKVLVKSGGVIKLCSTTTSSISCADTDLPDFDTTLLRDGTTEKYLKSNGNNVFYRVGTSPTYTLKVGNIFDPPSALITVSDASGGNASLDLNKFAFNFKPPGALCATQILYLPSRTESQKRYTIAQPSNACVTRILKVY